ncbi:hypothetical protein HHK36_021143 [Tetracentron sinense]|uniref:Receptor ligand binding region domain-containing protein n=1 Tax=Tetracentron sinense TaxID=13715 RepID=A0A834YUI8_TETSI|nr:hypothetical protein HHK36_021143 [Tetracentron sinense]
MENPMAAGMVLGGSSSRPPFQQSSYAKAVANISRLEESEPGERSKDGELHASEETFILQRGEVGEQLIKVYGNYMVVRGARTHFKLHSKFDLNVNIDDYANALSSGNVSAIVDEIPYIRLFLAKFYDTYTMINPKYITNGFGFVKAIAAIVNAFRWRGIFIFYEDSTYGNGVISYLINALEEVDERVPYGSIIPLSDPMIASLKSCIN